MTQTYQEMANAILKKRKKPTDKHNGVQIEQIKTAFIAYVLRGYFKNIIDLIIESKDLLFDGTDNEFILQELLKLDGVTIKKVRNSTKKFNNIISFTQHLWTQRRFCVLFRFRASILL